MKNMKSENKYSELSPYELNKAREYILSLYRGSTHEGMKEEYLNELELIQGEINKHLFRSK